MIEIPRRRIIKIILYRATNEDLDIIAHTIAKTLRKNFRGFGMINIKYLDKVIEIH